MVKVSYSTRTKKAGTKKFASYKRRRGGKGRKNDVLSIRLVDDVGFIVRNVQLLQKNAGELMSFCAASPFDDSRRMGSRGSIASDSE